MLNALTISDINTQVSDEPRVSHVRLAAQFGYVQANNMQRLIDRHRGALERFGAVSSTVEETTRKGGRPGKVYWLNKRQALYLCAKSDTTNATEVTIQMVEVFDAYTSNQSAHPERADLSNPIVLQRLLLEQLGARVKAERLAALPPEQRAKFTQDPYDFQSFPDPVRPRPAPPVSIPARPAPVTASADKPAKTPRTFLTATQLFERWNGVVAAGTLANWRSKKVGPAFVKLRGKILYPLEKVEAWEQESLMAPKGH